MDRRALRRLPRLATASADTRLLFLLAHRIAARGAQHFDIVPWDDFKRSVLVCTNNLRLNSGQHYAASAGVSFGVSDFLAASWKAAISW